MSHQILLLVCGSLFLLQAQSDNQPRFSVSGTVVNSVSNEPVPRALVTAGGAVATTDASGHFEVDGVKGPYLNLFARRPGFDKENRQDRTIKLDANLENITLKLVPLSKISGRVLDEDGEPVEGVFVQCFAQQIVNGRKQWQPRKGAATDETGSYVMEELPAGAYILSTQQKPLYSVRPKSEAARYLYPPTYYPDSPSRSLAQQLAVAPGAEARADISLHSRRGIRVTLTTVPPVANVMASIVEEENQFGRNMARAGKLGELMFPAVSPGTFKVVARGPFNRGQGESNEQPLYGEVQIDAGATDIDNVKLPLNKLANIAVSVSGPESAKVYLQLFSESGMMNGTNAEPNGVVMIQNVQPGTYRVAVPFNGGDAPCVTSLMAGSQDLLHDELVVSSGAPVPPIQVVTGSNCPEVTVQTNKDQPSMLVVTSDNREFQPREMSIGSRSGTVVKGLSEGDYKVYAFDDANGLEYTNPDAMRDFKCQAIHLEAGQKATVQLEVNERRAP